MDQPESYPPPTIADSVNSVYRAVVKITTQQTDFPASTSLQSSPSIPNHYSELSTSGSGVVIDSSGLILTNAHVVNDDTDVMITLWTGEQVVGHVLGIDSQFDMALIQAASDGLSSAPMGDSDQVRLGEWAIAIGSPLGLDHTVTVGIISATGRRRDDMQRSGHIGEFIQTDAAINPGNSGGPLLNHQGELIGVTTARLSGAQGIGFAIPINEAKQFIQQVLRAETDNDDQPLASQPHNHAVNLLANHSSEVFGIRATIVSSERVREPSSTVPTSEPLERFDDAPNVSSNSRLHGELEPEHLPSVVVIDVIPNSPANQAGIRVGDVISSINGYPISTIERLRELIQSPAQDNAMVINVMRNGQNLILNPVNYSRKPE
ncbi:MAG: trypsin-like peptidase domain-containing protein [Cyanobacteria bacterium P01_A01_bin.37]